MRRRSKQKAILTAGLGIAATALVGPLRNDLEHGFASVVNADPCGVPIRCYATGSDGPLGANGGYGVFDVEDYSAPDYQQGGHTNQTLWTIMDNDPQEWCEVGWIKGWKGDGHYFHYWAQQKRDPATGNYIYTDHLSTYPVGNSGTTHAYQIYQVSQGVFAVYIDLSAQGNCFSPGQVYTLYVGLEATNYRAKAAPDEPRSLQWRSALSGQWYAWLGGSYEGQVHNPPFFVWSWIAPPDHGRDQSTN